MAFTKNQDKNSESNEAKSLIRAMEDLRDIQIQSSIEKELAGFKEKVNIELKHNSNLKTKLQQYKDINDREQKKHELMSSILSIFAKGNLNRVLAFSVDQVEKHKIMMNTKQLGFEKKLKEHIDDHTKDNALFLQFQEKQAKLYRLEKHLSSLREERKSFTDKMKMDIQVNNLLFQQNILEMAQHVLRYYNLNDKLKHPTQNIQKPTQKKDPIPSASSLKVPTEGTSQKSQKSKEAKVTFADTNPSQSSSLEFISAKDNAGVSSSTFKRFAMNDMDMDLMMENENQINDNNDVQMDDNDENISEIEIDDNIDEISNWTSLETPVVNRKSNNKKSNSPESKASSFDLDFTLSDNPVQQTSTLLSQPTTSSILWGMTTWMMISATCFNKKIRIIDFRMSITI